MFTVDLPVGTTLSVSMSELGEFALVHIGGGRFSMPVPPVGFIVMQCDGDPEPPETVSVTWVSRETPKNIGLARINVDEAKAALDAAAAAGEQSAVNLVAAMAKAEQELREEAEKAEAAKNAPQVFMPPTRDIVLPPGA